MDAASEFSDIVETLDSIRADLAEFRHETRRDLDVLKARLDGFGTRLESCATKADLAELKAEFKDVMLAQTRWILAGLVTVILAIYFRT